MSKMIYKKRDKCTPELLRQLSEKENVFFRFHNPYRRLSSRSKSWEMGYESELEAIREGSTVLEGKSCTKEAKDLMEFEHAFDSSYVVLAFEGWDTGQTGHDGEIVATYYKKVKCFNYEDFVNCFDYIDWNWQYIDQI